jgi:hypothetical protein
MRLNRQTVHARAVARPRGPSAASLYIVGVMKPLNDRDVTIRITRKDSHPGQGFVVSGQWLVSGRKQRVQSSGFRTLWPEP